VKFYKIKESVEDYMQEQGKDNPDLWMASMSLLNAAICEMVDLWNPENSKISELQQKLSKDKANLLGLGDRRSEEE